MTRAHESIVEDQFGDQAQAYVSSTVHAGGEDLDALASIAERDKPDHALDLGSGGGHVAYRLARHSKAVTAVDLSAAMLKAVYDTAKQRGLSNIATCPAPAERLPFDDAAFDQGGGRDGEHPVGDDERLDAVAPGDAIGFVAHGAGVGVDEDAWGAHGRSWCVRRDFGRVCADYGGHVCGLWCSCGWGGCGLIGWFEV